MPQAAGAQRCHSIASSHFQRENVTGILDARTAAITRPDASAVVILEGRQTHPDLLTQHRHVSPGHLRRKCPPNVLGRELEPPAPNVAYSRHFDANRLLRPGER
ncbi:unnamed protein product [Ectocarpus sp. 12 AP-2014]